MSNYKAFINASQSKQNSACAIIILGDNDDMHKKVLALKNCTTNRAELQGIKYILLAITDNNSSIEIGTINTYILSMLDQDANGDWCRIPTKNLDLINEVRNVIKNRNIKIVFGAGPHMEKVKWLAKSVYRLPGGLPAGAKSPLDI